VQTKGRNITLSLPGITLPLPGEPAKRSPSQAEWPSVAEGDDTGAPLDAWGADRVERASLPKQSGSHPSSSAQHRPVVLAEPSSLETGAGEAEGDAFELASRASRSTPSLDLVSEMSERFALGDFSGALRAAELVLGQDAGHELAAHYAAESRQKLEGLYLSRLSALGTTPCLALPESEVRWLGLDSRTGFLISRIDGQTDYETLLELSGMPRLEALRCLVELVNAKVVRIV
jgi:hypothetical protein